MTKLEFYTNLPVAFIWFYAMNYFVDNLEYMWYVKDDNYMWAVWGIAASIGLASIQALYLINRTIEIHEENQVPF